MSESAIENGPGPQLGASSAGGGRCLRAICLAIQKGALSSMRRQTIIRRRPPGRVARRRLAIAAAGLVKNMVPNRAKQTSNGRSNFTVCPSASSNAAPATPARAASARPMARNGSQQSIPSALPVVRAELDGRLAEAAPDVQHPLPRADGVHLQRALAVDGEPVRQHPPEAGELRHQDLVPDPDGLRVRRACFRHVPKIPPTPTLRTKKHNELQFDDNWRSTVADMTISGLVVGTYLAVLLVLAMYGFHRSSLVWLYYRNRHRRPRPLGQFAELPAVTVQLPLFNEMYVVERLLDAVAGIRYPRDRFQIQVLDDSTDETQEICKRKVADLARRFPDLEVEYIHRVDRGGFKAGALQNGLRTAKGEFVLIFDADFLPLPDILERAIHHFSDPRWRWCSAAGSTSTVTSPR